MNPPKIADYTSRKSYQQNYAKENREAINARKKAWRLARKNLSGLKELRQVRDTSEGGESPTCCGLENRHEENAPAQSL